MAIYMAGVLYMLRRASLDAQGWLPAWGMNVLGVAYIPVFLVDLLVFPRGLVQPVLHLGLFALLVKLFAIVRERDKWQASIGVFFLFLGAMGTSVHPAIVLYLFGVVGLFLVPRRFAALVVALLAYQWVFAMLFAGDTRYRAPWDFLLALCASVAVGRVWDRIRA